MKTTTKNWCFSETYWNCNWETLWHKQTRDLIDDAQPIALYEKKNTFKNDFIYAVNDESTDEWMDEKVAKKKIVPPSLCMTNQCEMFKRNKNEITQTNE